MYFLHAPITILLFNASLREKRFDFLPLSMYKNINFVNNLVIVYSKFQCGVYKQFICKRIVPIQRAQAQEKITHLRSRPSTPVNRRLTALLFVMSANYSCPVAVFSLFLIFRPTTLSAGSFWLLLKIGKIKISLFWI